MSPAAITVALVQLFPGYSVRGSYGLTFTVLFLAHAFALVTWRVVLWPKVFSPLRHLPEPSVSPR